MDPFTISTACIGVASGISALSTQIFTFASNIRDSRKDMDAVSRELSSLQMCLETLRNDAVTITYPPRIKENIYEILSNLQSKIRDMTTLLLKVQSSSTGRSLQWTTIYRDQVNAMRVGIEAYKSSLEIALELGSTLLITTVQETTDATRRDVALIRRDMAQVTRLLAGTRALRSQFNHLEEQGIGVSIPLQRFLEETESYAESVRDPTDDDGLSEATWEGPITTVGSDHSDNPFTGDDTSASDHSTFNIPRRPLPNQPPFNSLSDFDQVARHARHKFAEFVYVVPLFKTEIDKSLARRNGIDKDSRRQLDSELLAATTDTSRQPFKVIRNLVEQGADCTPALREELETRLAIRHDVVLHLIGMGATVDLNSNISHHHNHLDILRFLFHQRNCNFEAVNKPGDKNALHVAIRQAHLYRRQNLLKAILILCEHGLDVNRGNGYGVTPLFCALSYVGHERDSLGMKMLAVLLDWGAGPLVESKTRYIDQRVRPVLSALDEARSIQRGISGSSLHDAAARSTWNEVIKMFESYASREIRSKYYPGRPCSCRFSPPSPKPRSSTPTPTTTPTSTATSTTTTAAISDAKVAQATNVVPPKQQHQSARRISLVDMVRKKISNFEF